MGDHVGRGTDPVRDERELRDLRIRCDELSLSIRKLVAKREDVMLRVDELTDSLATTSNTDDVDDVDDPVEPPIVVKRTQSKKKTTKRRKKA